MDVKYYGLLSGGMLPPNWKGLGMADELTPTEWRTFLEARITQEKGNDAEALEVFDDLHSRYPQNPHVKASRAYALQRLGRTEDAQVARVDVEYSELGRTLIGDRDNPDAWVERLSSLVASLDRKTATDRISASLVVW